MLLLAALLWGPTGLVAEEKEEEPGVWVERADGSLVQLLLEEGRFQVHFRDAEKNPVRPVARRGAVHYTQPLRSRETVALMPSSGGMHLESRQYIRPPHSFQVVLVLIFDEAAQVTETYSLQFRPEDAEAGAAVSNY